MENRKFAVPTHFFWKCCTEVAAAGPNQSTHCEWTTIERRVIRGLAELGVPWTPHWALDSPHKTLRIRTSHSLFLIPFLVAQHCSDNLTVI
jgi:hypothetical protein